MVHEYIEDAAGEAWDGGPVILSWEDAQLSDGGFNVVIHEFAHKLDLQAGDADGMPSLAAHPDIAPRAWRRVLEDSLERFIAALDAVEAAIPPTWIQKARRPTPGMASCRWTPTRRPTRPSSSPSAPSISSSTPGPCATRCPEWYAMLRAYYRQDPAERLA